MKCRSIPLIRSEAPRKKVDGELLVGATWLKRPSDERARLVRGRVVYRSPSHRRD